MCLREGKRRTMRVAGKTHKKMTWAGKDKPVVCCDGRAESWICGGLKYWRVMSRHSGSPRVETNYMESKHSRPFPEKAPACLWYGSASVRVWLSLGFLPFICAPSPPELRPGAGYLTVSISTSVKRGFNDIWDDYENWSTIKMKTVRNTEQVDTIFAELLNFSGREHSFPLPSCGEGQQSV